MKTTTIRKGKPEDVPQILSLVKELAEYEKALHEVINTEEAMLRDGFGEHPSYGIFVAESDCVIEGVAIHYIRYSTWKGNMLYLEDIVVKEALRGQGIGSALFEVCLRLCVEKQYSGMCWQVLDWNEPALHFYRKYNSTLDAEWINGKLLLADIQSMGLS